MKNKSSNIIFTYLIYISNMFLEPEQHRWHSD